MCSQFDEFLSLVSGAGKLIIFVQILQKECDRETRKLVELFKNKRDFDLRVSGVSRCFSVYILKPQKYG